MTELSQPVAIRARALQERLNRVSASAAATEAMHIFEDHGDMV